MARRQHRNNIGTMLSIEGMGIAPQKSLPIIVKKNTGRKPYMYRRRMIHSKPLVRLNSKVRTQRKHSKKSSSKKKKLVLKQSRRTAPAAAPALAAAAPVPDVASQSKPITLHEKALWLLGQNADPGRSGEVAVLYSHYKALFKVHNGM